MIRYEHTVVHPQELPHVWQVTEGSGASIDEVCAWLGDERPMLERDLRQHGAVLVRGLEALDCAQSFERFMNVLSPRLMDYVGGTSPRKTVHGKIMTATEMAADVSIPLHQEMSYTDNSPERIAFFCLSPAPEGGFTTVGDMRALTRRIDAAVRGRFAEKKVQLRRTLPSQASLHKKPGVAKAWTEAFNTEDRDEVGRIAARRGWRTAWLSDDSVQLWQEVRPPTKVHPVTGDEVWHNQAHIFAPVPMIAWARKDGRHAEAERIEYALQHHPEMVDRVFHGTGEMVADEDVMHVFQVLDEAAVPVHWQRHDVLLLDNILAAHGRTMFRGPRQILTALVQDLTI